jgi:4-amino-4-deoxy-L-arabinose transferase-like glycosyltransferase
LVKRRGSENNREGRPRGLYCVSWKLALIVFLAALSFRGAYLWEASQRPDFNLFYMDEEYHLEWAKALTTGVWNPPYDQLKDAPYFRAPLYPYFLAGLLAVSGNDALAARAFQIILGSISCVFVYMLATGLFGRRVGFAAGLICSCYWVLAYFDAQLLLPVLLVFLVTVGMLAALKAVEKNSLPLAIGAGLAFGLYSITRPNMLIFFPFLAWWAVSLRKWQTLKVRRWFAPLLIAGLILPPAAVTLRNRIVGKDWVIVASQGGVNFYIGNNPRSNGMQAVVPGTRQTWWGGYEDTHAIAERAAGRTLKPSEVSDYWFRRGLDYIRDDPAGWLRLTLRKMVAFAGNVEIPNNEPYEAYRGDFTSLRILPLGFGVVFGLFLLSLPFQLKTRKRLLRRGSAGDAARGGLIGLSLMLVGAYVVTVVGFFVTGRYRVPLVPFFAMGSAVTVVGVYDLFRSRALFKVLGLMCVAVAVVAVLNRDNLGIRRVTAGFSAFTMAEDKLDTGDVNGAIAILEKIRESGSVRAPEVYKALARAYLGRGSPGDRDAVLKTAEEGLRLYPADPELLWYSAVGNADHKDWTMAGRRVAAFLEVRPDDLRGLFLGFTASMETGDIEAARAYFERALAVKPGDPLVGQMRRRLDDLSP